jgi:hypothetical protein
MHHFIVVGEKITVLKAVSSLDKSPALCVANIFLQIPHQKKDCLMNKTITA